MSLQQASGAHALYTVWGDEPLLAVEGGRNYNVSFAVSRYAQSPTTVARARGEANDTFLANMMLFNLPVNTQNVYRVLLMVPLGALVVAFMRTIVGLPTLGNVAPVRFVEGLQHTLYNYLLAPLAALVGLAWVVRRNKPGIDAQDAPTEER